jgi:hypothetical protein
MVASVALLKAAGTGYGIGLGEHGDRIEFIGDWRALVGLRDAIESAGEPQPADLEEWQILAVNGELKLPLSRAALAERASYLTAAFRRTSGD